MGRAPVLRLTPRLPLEWPAGSVKPETRLHSRSPAATANSGSAVDCFRSFPAPPRTLKHKQKDQEKSHFQENQETDVRPGNEH